MKYFWYEETAKMNSKLFKKLQDENKKKLFFNVFIKRINRIDNKLLVPKQIVIKPDYFEPYWFTEICIRWCTKGKFDFSYFSSSDKCKYKAIVKLWAYLRYYYKYKNKEAFEWIIRDTLDDIKEEYLLRLKWKDYDFKEGELNYANR